MGNLHDSFGGFDGLAVLESTLPFFCLFYKIQCQETTVTVLTVLAVSAVVAVSVVTATLLKLNSIELNAGLVSDRRAAMVLMASNDSTLRSRCRFLPDADLTPLQMETSAAKQINQGSPVRFGCGLRIESIDRFERFRFSVLAVPLGKGVPLCLDKVLREKHGSGSVLANGSDGHSSNLGSCKNGCDGSGFLFQFHSCSADCKRGRRQGATPKIVKNCQDEFRYSFDNFYAGQKTSKSFKMRQNIFRHFPPILAGHQFSGPFELGALTYAILIHAAVCSAPTAWLCKWHSVSTTNL